MSITKILSEEKTSAEEKLNRIGEIIAQARSAYGNEDAEIDSPKVTTINGEMSFVHLDDSTKVYVLSSEVAKIKCAAVEFVEQNPGANINKKIEELISVNGMFTNISAGTKFEYI